MSQSRDASILANIKLERTETTISESNLPSSRFAEAGYDDEAPNEVYNSDLIEDLRPNEQITNDIRDFIAARDQEKNRTNLINYCGILDADIETEGCARVNSIYVAKYGQSHIKSTLKSVGFKRDIFNNLICLLLKKQR